MTPRRLEVAALSVACLSFFLVLFDGSALNIALPSVQDQLGGSVAGLQWVVNGYAVPMASVLLAAGALGDRWGARSVVVGALALFAAGSAAAALSPTLGTLVASRVVQGVAAGGILPGTMALLAEAYQEPVRRAKALATWGGTGSLALVLGPTVGGLITAGAGWRAIFWVNPPICAVAALVCHRQLPAGRTGRRPRLDLPGQLLSTLASAALVGALIAGGDAGWTAPLTLVLAAIAVAAAVGLVLAETRVAEPMLPPALFRSGSFSAPLGIGFAFQLAAYGVQFVLGLHLQRAWGLGPAGAGAAFLPLTAAWAFGSLVLARLAARRGPRPPLAVGAAAAAAGAALLLPLGPAPGWAWFVAGTTIVGLGAGLLAPSMPAAVLAAAPPGQSGVAAGSLNAFRQVGGAVGVSVLGALLGTGGPGTGLRWDMLTVLVAFTAIVAATMRWVPGVASPPALAATPRMPQPAESAAE